MTSHLSCDVTSTFDLTHIALKNCHRNIAHQQGEKCSYWGCQVTQRVGSATRTPDVEAVAVVRIVRRTDQVHTVSPTSSRHRQVIKHDALDLGDEGGQHHAVERRHNTNRAIFDRSTCSLSSSSQLHRTHVMSSVRKMAAKNRCSSRSCRCAPNLYLAQRYYHRA